MLLPSILHGLELLFALSVSRLHTLGEGLQSILVRPLRFFERVRQI